MIEYHEFSLDRAEENVRAFFEGIGDASVETAEFGVLARRDGAEVGYVLLRMQPIAPMMVGPLQFEALEGLARPALDSRREAFVLDFQVKDGHRRQGIGAELQRRAIRMSRERGAYQMRSWSSLDRPENYRLKLRLGFAAVPGTQYVDRAGKWVEGTYFVMPLAGVPTPLDPPSHAFAPPP